MNKSIAGFIALLLLASCALFAESRSWQFVQSVGGIEIGIPVQSDNGWILPLRCDVSGLRAITVKPTTLNSGLSCGPVEVVTEGKTIFITLKTDVAGKGRSAVCPAALLGNLPAGKYSVFYRYANENPVALGEISIVPHGTGMTPLEGRDESIL